MTSCKIVFTKNTIQKGHSIHDRKKFLHPWLFDDENRDRRIIRPIAEAAHKHRKAFCVERSDMCQHSVALIKTAVATVIHTKRHHATRFEQRQTAINSWQRRLRSRGNAVIGAREITKVENNGIHRLWRCVIRHLRVARFDDPCTKPCFCKPLPRRLHRLRLNIEGQYLPLPANQTAERFRVMPTTSRCINTKSPRMNHRAPVALHKCQRIQRLFRRYRPHPSLSIFSHYNDHPYVCPLHKNPSVIATDGSDEFNVCRDDDHRIHRRVHVYGKSIR